MEFILKQPTNESKKLNPTLAFQQASSIMSENDALKIVENALSKFQATTPEQASYYYDTLCSEFPDHVSNETYWNEYASVAFKDFFTWGHNHNFGFGKIRNGAMQDRHIEITKESILNGFLDTDLQGKKVLCIGCWSGGDALILAGLGAEVTAIEEHELSARSAHRLFELVGADIEIVTDSLYKDNQKWLHHFDHIYCSGVIYHVTDPLLFMRICFAYLKPGGKLIIETKAGKTVDNHCLYSGTSEKGWNWFSPNPEVLGRWFYDAGFPFKHINIYQRPIGRLLAAGTKEEPTRLPEPAGFSRPGSWLEGEV